MTPDLMEEGAQRLEKIAAVGLAGNTASGGRAAGFSRLVTPGEVDTTHGRILYLEGVNVSFDGFKAIGERATGRSAMDLLTAAAKVL